jgi:hypothetical protein
MASRSPWRSRSVIGARRLDLLRARNAARSSTGLRARYSAVTVTVRSAGARHTARRRAPSRSA